jgi:mono/diheme cytochrome c family protein
LNIMAAARLSLFRVLLATALLAMTAACATAKEERPPEAGAASVGAVRTKAPPRPTVNLEQFKIGFRIAVIDCSDCHAIDQKSKSLEPRAPPLRELLSRYGDLDLAASLILHAAAGKGEMPVHQLNKDAADALVAYISVIGAPATPQPVK